MCFADTHGALMHTSSLRRSHLRRSFVSESLHAEGLPVIESQHTKGPLRGRSKLRRALNEILAVMMLGSGSMTLQRGSCPFFWATFGGSSGKRVTRIFTSSVRVAFRGSEVFTFACCAAGGVERATRAALAAFAVVVIVVKERVARVVRLES